jgi:hypothetical protein
MFLHLQSNIWEQQHVAFSLSLHQDHSPKQMKNVPDDSDMRSKTISTGAHFSICRIRFARPMSNSRWKSFHDMWPYGHTPSNQLALNKKLA